MPKPAKSDLVWQLYKQLRDADIHAVIVHYENGFIKEIKIGRTSFMTKFANGAAKDGRHWFGFTVEDIEYSRSYAEAILVIGNDKIERCYSVPYSHLTAYIKTGAPVHIPRSDYDSYKATIFPNSDYEMKVEKGDGSSFRIENYKIANVTEYFKKFLLKTNAG